MEAPQYSAHFPQYDLAIQEGEQLGIYSWILLSHSDPLELFPLIEHHPDSAFFLFCRPEDMTPAILDEIAPLKHLMPVVRWEDGADKACTMLRNAQLPYSVYYPYAEKDLQYILNGDLFRETQKLHPLFTALAAKPGCPLNIQHQTHQSAIQVREGQSYQTVPWELSCDTQNLDEIISDDACCVFFDGQGQLFALDSPDRAPFGNLFQDGLMPLLRQAYPKSAPVSSQ